MIGFHIYNIKQKENFFSKAKGPKIKTRLKQPSCAVSMAPQVAWPGYLTWLHSYSHMLETFKMAAVEDEVDKDGEDVTFKSLVIRGYNTHF